MGVFFIHICWEAQILVSINFHYKISRYNHHLYNNFLNCLFDLSCSCECLNYFGSFSIHLCDFSQALHNYLAFCIHISKCWRRPCLLKKNSSPHLVPLTTFYELSIQIGLRLMLHVSFKPSLQNIEISILVT